MNPDCQYCGAKDCANVEHEPCAPQNIKNIIDSMLDYYHPIESAFIKSRKVIETKDKRIAEVELENDTIGKHLSDACNDIHDLQATIKHLKEENAYLNPTLTKTYPDGTSKTHPAKRVIGLQEIEIKHLKSLLREALGFPIDNELYDRITEALGDK